MTTKVVRLLEEDVEWVSRLSGLPDSFPFAAKAHVLLRRFERSTAELEAMRLVVRQELERLTGEP